MDGEKRSMHWPQSSRKDKPDIIITAATPPALAAKWAHNDPHRDGNSRGSIEPRRGGQSRPTRRQRNRVILYGTELNTIAKRR